MQYLEQYIPVLQQALTRVEWSSPNVIGVIVSSVIAVLTCAWVVTRYRRFVQLGAWLSAAVAAALYLAPSAWPAHLPAGSDVIGLILLAFSAVAMLSSSARLMGSAMACAFWFFVSATVGTKLFLDQLPHQVVFAETPSSGVISKIVESVREELE